tara:strand:+ start:64 stop:237 length:174 start_codon:yes stop_codon:yes gene_type:complete
VEEPVVIKMDQEDLPVTRVILVDQVEEVQGMVRIQQVLQVEQVIPLHLVLFKDSMED